MKVAIVGAGWYGCHLAVTLLQRGVSVDIFEKSNSTISGASRYNQNRLHQGFHYPRDYSTRVQSHEGFDWFMEHYSNLIQSVNNNIYGIANKFSNLDFNTYLQIMRASGLRFSNDIKEAISGKFNNVEGMIITTEMMILNNRASAYFDDVLSKHIQFNTEILLSDESVLNDMKKEYDYLIDCTWGCSKDIPGLDYYYEPCIYFYYEKKTSEDFAFTLMDGDFFSIYPYSDERYTVTSVKNTPISQVTRYTEVDDCFKMAKKKSYIDAKRILFESEIEQYYPGFRNDFEYVKPVYSLKTKMVSVSDFRGCVVVSDDRVISVFSGKIDTLHVAEKEVMRIINE
jgi:uncharacterized protein with NAD-binding domain and iron-sulfur cluster